MTGVDITEDWLASVGFKYREPGERQQFRHWTLTFSEQEDYGLYLEMTMPGWINRNGEHVGTERGWFLWIGREHKFIHLRHVFDRSEVVALVEALTGQPWSPSRMGNVPMKRRERHQKPDTEERGAVSGQDSSFRTCALEPTGAGANSTNPSVDEGMG